MDSDTNKNSKRIKEIYRYDEMSNIVLDPENKLKDNTIHDEKDSSEYQPKSLSGKISKDDMGANNIHRSNGVTTKEELDIVDGKNLVEEDKKPNNMRSLQTEKFSSRNTLLDIDELTEIKYHPTNDTTFAVYEEILEWVVSILGTDIPHQVIIETADMLISVFREESDNDGNTNTLQEQHKSVEEILSLQIDKLKFQSLIKLVTEISDYNSNPKEKFSADKVVTVVSSDDEAETNTGINDAMDALERDNDEYGQIDNLKNNTTEKDLLLELSKSTINLGYQNNKVFSNIKIYDLTKESFYDILKANTVNELDSTGFEVAIDSVVNLISNNSVSIDALSNSLNKQFKVLPSFLIEDIISNRDKLLWAFKLSESTDKEKEHYFNEMRDIGLKNMVEEYLSVRAVSSKRSLEGETENTANRTREQTKKIKVSLKALQEIDMELLSNGKEKKHLVKSSITLPEGSFKRVKPSYEEIHIPPPKKISVDFDLLAISDLPSWAQKAFPTNEIESLNVIQSKVFNTAFESDENMLICAPTGAGKTNIALIAMLRCISKYFDNNFDKLRIEKFKIVFIAPLKALVQEQVREFQRRLLPYGINVAELTGDSNLSKAQIKETQILVSTPEKWDIITRNSNDVSFTELVDLLIIDEVHLLHDQRGPVIESIVSRSLANGTLKAPRIVAMSATLPNYKDIGKFLRVNEKGLFYFDSSYRPCPLSQQFCGVTEKNSMKKIKGMNEACYDKVLEAVNEGHQVIVFVHSRKDTFRTAEYLKNEFLQNHLLDKIRNQDPASREILKSESDNAKSMKLKDLFPFGIGVHHAGLERGDRSLSEDLFADGLLKILVSTATLAWGVNLPAHTVIIKGTDIYSPESSSWEQLSPQDVLQMLGRAGRPRYDTHGDGVIITHQSDIQYYLAVLTNQLPIESQMYEKLINCLNAEIVLGNIVKFNDGIDWFHKTYLYIRMLVSPEEYKISDIKHIDSFIESLIHTCFKTLYYHKLAIYNEFDLSIEATELGKIASYYYIDYKSTKTYYDSINKNMDTSELLKLFAVSTEFQYISVRPEERKELMALKSKSPFPISELNDENTNKTNILLQAYISRIPFESFALHADMNFVTQNAGRLMKAIYEICLLKKYAKQTKLALSLCKSIDKRMWLANSPLRQFKGCPIDVIRRMEASFLQWNDYLDLDSPNEVGKAIRSEKYGKLAFDLFKRFPRLKIDCQVRTITPSLFLFDVIINPTWKWDHRYHSIAEPFTIIVEDSDGEQILYSDSILIYKDNVNFDHTIQFSLEFPNKNINQVPPNIFINIISERWMQSSELVSVDLSKLIKPRKFPAPRELTDSEIILTSATAIPEVENLLDVSKFDIYISSCFEALFNSNENIFLASNKKPNDTTGCELVLLNHWRQNKGRCIYVHPSQIHIDNLITIWESKFSNFAGGKVIQKLCEDLTLNIRCLAQSHLILGTPAQFNSLSRKWTNRKNLQNIELIIYDGLHEVGSPDIGPIYETLIARLNLMFTQLEKSSRIVGFSSPIANSRDFSDFIGVKKKYTYNFSAGDRIEPLNIQFMTHNNMRVKSCSNLMRRQAFENLFEKGKSSKRKIIYMSSLKDCYHFSEQCISYCSFHNIQLTEHYDLKTKDMINEISNFKLKNLLRNGIGLYYQGMSLEDEKTVLKLYNDGMIPSLVIPFDSNSLAPFANTTLILGTYYYDEHEHSYYRYDISTINEIISRTTTDNSLNIGEVLIFTNLYAKDYYKKFITESAPIESNLLDYFHDFILNEVCTTIIENKQDCLDFITYSFFYRRLHANPSFYGLQDTSGEGISEFLTNLINSITDELSETSLIAQTPSSLEVDSDKLSVLPLSNIVVKYNISFHTIRFLISILSGSSTMRDILEALSHAVEFEPLVTRSNELPFLINLQKRLPLKYSKNVYENSRSFKVFILLQSYFSRLSISIPLSNDLKYILKFVSPLISSIVDIMASNGWLNTTTAMDLSQMFIQGVWDTDVVLKQIPYFDENILKLCAVKGVEGVYDFMALEDEERDEILDVDNKKLNKIANFVNNYPNIEVQYELETTGTLIKDETNTITVTVSRDEEPETNLIISNKYPYDKVENWWIVLGEVGTRELFSIRRVTLSKETQNFKLPFLLEKTGEHNLTLWCICDSYLDADKEVSFNVTVA